MNNKILTDNGHCVTQEKKCVPLVHLNNNRVVRVENAAQRHN